MNTPHLAVLDHDATERLTRFLMLQAEIDAGTYLPDPMTTALSLLDAHDAQ